jgi:hypothetical protein
VNIDVHCWFVVWESGRGVDSTDEGWVGASSGGMEIDSGGSDGGDVNAGSIVLGVLKNSFIER